VGKIVDNSFRTTDGTERRAISITGLLLSLSLPLSFGVGVGVGVGVVGMGVEVEVEVDLLRWVSQTLKAGWRSVGCCCLDSTGESLFASVVRVLGRLVETELEACCESKGGGKGEDGKDEDGIVAMAINGGETGLIGSVMK